MKQIKPALKRDKNTGTWSACYTSEFGQQFLANGHSPQEAMAMWYKRFGKKFGVGGKGG